MRLSFIFLAAAALAAEINMTYPPARRSDQADVLHGVRVEDPYRWLEDADSAETRAWVTAENALTEQYLSQIPARDRIKRRLTELWNFERYAGFFKESNRYFLLRNDGLQNQNVLYTLPSLHGKERVLLDPNELSKDGTVALSGFYVSKDGKQLAYSISRSGSDWLEWRVRSIETGRDLPDLLRWSKFSSAAWSTDNKGFYYQRFAEPRSDRRADRNQLQREALLSSGRPAAVVGRADLRASRTEGLAIRLDYHRGRPLSDHDRQQRRRRQEPGVLPRPEIARRENGRAGRRL